jgi:uncharacterized protein (DUF4415 family)
MKQTSTTTTSATSEADDAPVLTQDDFDRARFRVAGREVSRAEWQAAARTQVARQRVSLQLDAPIVEHFKALAGGRHYGELINQTLRRVVEGEYRESDLRAIVRDELAQRFGPK